MFVRAYVSEITGLGVKTVRNALAALERNGEIKIVGPVRAKKVATGGAIVGAIVGTRIRIINYDTYDALSQVGAGAQKDMSFKGARNKEGVKQQIINNTSSKTGSLTQRYLEHRRMA